MNKFRLQPVDLRESSQPVSEEPKGTDNCLGHEQHPGGGTGKGNEKEERSG